MTAPAKVFSTFELLESILFVLSTKDLLFAQKVCKQWQAIIGNSVKLQQALFLKPLPGGALSYEQAQKNYGKVVKNPLLEPFFDFISNLEIEGYGRVAEMLADSDYVSSSWLAPHASWRKMLPTQPATKSIFSVHVFISREEETWSWEEEDLVEDIYEDWKDEDCSGREIRMEPIFFELDKIAHRLWETGSFTDIPCSALDMSDMLKSNSELEDMKRAWTINSEKELDTDEESTSQDESESGDEMVSDEDMDSENGSVSEEEIYTDYDASEEGEDDDS